MARDWDEWLPGKGNTNRKIWTGLHHNHNILLVAFRTTLVYHETVLNQASKQDYSPALPTGCCFLFPAIKGSTIVGKHEQEIHVLFNQCSPAS